MAKLTISKDMIEQLKKCENLREIQKIAISNNIDPKYLIDQFYLYKTIEKNKMEKINRINKIIELVHDGYHPIEIAYLTMTPKKKIFDILKKHNLIARNTFKKYSTIEIISKLKNKGYMVKQIADLIGQKIGKVRKIYDKV